MLKHCIELLMQQCDLTSEQAEQGLLALLESDNTAQQSAFLALLHSKGETAQELAGLVRALRAIATPMPGQGPVLDIVGTGGDGANTVNISTAAAIVAASCGARVAKHGNRSVSSRSGAADVLEALGVEINLDPEQAAECLDAAGVVFMFFRRFYAKAASLVPVRQALGVRTTINMLGPLLNPCGTRAHMLIGVSSPKMLRPMAETARLLGVPHSIVVHGCGLDELTPLGPIDMIEIRDGKCTELTLDPADFGMARCQLEDLQGGEAQDNAELILEAFAGTAGALGDALALTAGVGLYLYGTASSMPDGLKMAQAALADGRAVATLETLRRVSNAVCTSNIKEKIS